MPMVKTLFLVPERDNEGAFFGEELGTELERRLLEFGGFSRRSGVVGAWRFERRIYRDVSFQYDLSLESWRQLPAWLAVVEWVIDAYDQEAVYIEVAGVPEILGRAGPPTLT